MDTTVTDTPKKKQVKESNPAAKQYKILPLPSKVVKKSLDFSGNSSMSKTGGAVSAQSRAELSSFSFGYVPTPLAAKLPAPTASIPSPIINNSQSRARRNIDPRLRVEANTRDIPSSIGQKYHDI